MASADTDKAIRQMRNFILQEAHEKSNEIKLKVRFLSFRFHKCSIRLLSFIFCYTIFH